MNKYHIFTGLQIFCSIYMLYYLHKLSKTFKKYSDKKGITWNKNSKKLFFISHYFLVALSFGANYISVRYFSEMDWFMAGSMALIMVAYASFILRDAHLNALKELKGKEA